jgi:hypothetical protein
MPFAAVHQRRLRRNQLTSERRRLLRGGVDLRLCA